MKSPVFLRWKDCIRSRFWWSKTRSKLHSYDSDNIHALLENGDSMKRYPYFIVLSIFAAFLFTLSSCRKTNPVVFTEAPPRELEQILGETDLYKFNYELHRYLHSKSNHGAELDKLSDAECTVYLCDWVCDEVNADGFAFFFSNYGTDLSEEITEAYIEIGAEETARIYQDALDILEEAEGSSSSLLSLLRDQETMDALSTLDLEFCDYPDDLNVLIHDYVLANRADFS